MTPPKVLLLVLVNSALLLPLGFSQQVSPGPQTVFCGSPDFAALRLPNQLFSPTDCGFSSNTTGPEYDPTYTMVIPVVWHVITQTNGTGNVTDIQI